MYTFPSKHIHINQSTMNAQQVVYGRRRCQAVSPSYPEYKNIQELLYMLINPYSFSVLTVPNTGRYRPCCLHAARLRMSLSNYKVVCWTILSSKVYIKLVSIASDVCLDSPSRCAYIVMSLSYDRPRSSARFTAFLHDLQTEHRSAVEFLCLPAVYRQFLLYEDH